MSLTLEDAKAMMSDEAILKLKNMVTPKPVVNMDHKVNNDIIMSALCRAVDDGVINVNSLNEKIIKLLNSPTNTLSAVKVGSILTHIRKSQPNICCIITLKTADMNTVLNEWVFTGPDVYFNKIFEYVVDYFKITPTIVRNKMTEMLKTTIVNNVAQLIAKYNTLESEEEKQALTISISTVTRLVNMSDHILLAEFKELK
jgi:hypothetical protein